MLIGSGRTGGLVTANCVTHGGSSGYNSVGGIPKEGELCQLLGTGGGGGDEGGAWHYAVRQSDVSLGVIPFGVIDDGTGFFASQGKESFGVGSWE
jgi:hypothetical protein